MKSFNTRSLMAILSSLALTLIVAAFLPGCGGETEPPPLEAADLEKLQEKQQQIFTKEYGPKAVKSKKDRTVKAAPAKEKDAPAED